MIWVAIGLLLVFVDRSTTYLGYGHTDVTVEFRVVEADGGQPVEGVGLLVYTSGKQEIELTTNSDGVATYEDTAAVYSETSGLGWTDRRLIAGPCAYVFVKPTWRHEEPEEPISLGSLGSPFHGKAVRTGPGRAKLVVPIALRKSAP
jgi:hypothetical protein